MKTQNIVGQETLVKEISRIFEIFKASESEVRPHSILKGGNLGKQEAKAISFQNTLSWKESN